MPADSQEVTGHTAWSGAFLVSAQPKIRQDDADDDYKADDVNNGVHSVL